MSVSSWPWPSLNCSSFTGFAMQWYKHGTAAFFLPFCFSDSLLSPPLKKMVQTDTTSLQLSRCPPYCVTVCVCVCVPQKVGVRLYAQSHAEHSVPTRLEERCPEVGGPLPTGSPFQRLETPLCTMRPDMIPQHCRRGREPGTVLIRQALLSRENP